MKNKMIAGLLCAVVLTASVCSLSGAARAATSTAVTAQLRPNVAVQIDGTVHTFYNAQGQEVFPILYNGTTYLPLRSMGEVMNKNVTWNSATNTVTMGGVRTDSGVVGVPNHTAKQTDVTFYLRPDITVVIDDVVRTFYDSTGKQVSPAVYNGSIYLPVRSVGEMMGKTVYWDSKTQTVVMNAKQGNGDVTDYDSANNGTVVPPATNPTTPETGKAVTLEQAKQIALNHAKKTATQVTFVKANKGFDDGRWEYEIEFIVASENGYLEYDYEIDAATGKILSCDYDAEGYAPATNGNGTQATVGEDAAKKTALARVPGATAANLRQFKLDYDDGRLEYEGKIVYKQMEYEFVIDGSTGTVVEWEVESIYD